MTPYVRRYHHGLTGWILVVPIIAGLTAPLKAARHSADAPPARCQDCGECGGKPLTRIVPLKFYRQGHMGDDSIAQMLRITNHIWNRYGVGFESSASDEAIDVIVSNATASPSTDRPSVLGDTIFTGGHATPYIHLWPRNAELLARDADIDGQRFASMPEYEQTGILTHMLGVVLAHELGHYLLDMANHSSQGLLRANLTVAELARSAPGRFQLTPEQRMRMCTAHPLSNSQR